jgi:hypothetical protein
MHCINRFFKFVFVVKIGVKSFKTFNYKFDFSYKTTPEGCNS